MKLAQIFGITSCLGQTSRYHSTVTAPPSTSHSSRSHSAFQLTSKVPAWIHWSIRCSPSVKALVLGTFLPSRRYPPPVQPAFIVCIPFLLLLLLFVPTLLPPGCDTTCFNAFHNFIMSSILCTIVNSFHTNIPMFAPHTAGAVSFLLRPTFVDAMVHTHSCVVTFFVMTCVYLIGLCPGAVPPSTFNLVSCG